MDGYRIALAIHLFALVAATAASALSHFAESRSQRALTIDDARHWYGFALSVARVFPIAIVVLFATGAWMIGIGNTWTWTSGWIDAGIAGTITLFVVGGFLGARARLTTRELARLAADVNAGRNVELPRDAVLGLLSWMNTGLAIAIVFVMAAKMPLVESLVALLVGAILGLGVGLTTHRDRELTAERSAG